MQRRKRSTARPGLARKKLDVYRRMMGEVPSPCIGVCRFGDDGETCIGCHRRDDEISGWFHYDDDERRAVLKRAERRRMNSSAA